MRCIGWVLLLQEFVFEVKYQKGCKNQVADHLSRLENEQPSMEEPKIDYYFLDEQILAATLTLITCYTDFTNFFVSDINPVNLSFH